MSKVLPFYFFSFTLLCMQDKETERMHVDGTRNIHARFRLKYERHCVLAELSLITSQYLSMDGLTVKLAQNSRLSVVSSITFAVYANVQHVYHLLFPNTRQIHLQRQIQGVRYRFHKHSSKAGCAHGEPSLDFTTQPTSLEMKLFLEGNS